jgi:hypothetical protein
VEKAAINDINENQIIIFGNSQNQNQKSQNRKKISKHNGFER